jgi:hypothetical protein
MATWLDDTITALKNLGGEAHLNDIFKEVKRIRKTLSPSWTRTIQKELERHSSDSIVWNSKYRGKEDLFYSAKGIGQGVWGLRQKRNFWFVSQSQTFKFERPGGYLWAPYTNKAGGKQFHDDTMAMVRKGDIMKLFSPCLISIWRP